VDSCHHDYRTVADPEDDTHIAVILMALEDDIHVAADSVALEENPHKTAMARVLDSDAGTLRCQLAKNSVVAAAAAAAAGVADVPQQE
jgi:hypothetical protein